MIGGEIEIDPEYAAPFKGSPVWAILDLPDGRSTFFGTAREAVRWWIDHLKPPGPVLLPAYCCWSVVQPFREAGVEYRYYPVDRRLRADPALARRIAADSGAGAIQVVHYFGFPADAGLFKIGIPVLEDAVQALLSPELRQSGDWAVGSLRKFLPVPDGAFLIARKPFKVPRLPPAAGGIFGRKLYARMLKHEAVKARDAARWAESLKMLEATEDALDHDEIVYHAMSPRTADALRGMPARDMAAARRHNYLSLYGALRPAFAQARHGLAPLLGELPSGVVPYGLPVLSEHRDALKAHLAAKGIHSVVHWDLPDDIDPEEFPDSWWLCKRELTLPTDHRYGPPEMATVAAAVASFKP